MFYIFRKIKLKYIFSFLFISCFSSNLLAKDSHPVLKTDKQISTFDNIDVLRLYRPKNTFILRYLNAILNRILENNEDILSEYKMQKQDFTTSFLIQDEANARATSIKEIILILSEYDLLNTNIFSTDAYIEILFSHEIAHLLLGHLKQSSYEEVRILKEFVKHHENSKDFKQKHPHSVSTIDDLSFSYREQYEKYLKSHPDYVKLKRTHEIEADNLGFKLYSKLGYNIECYANSFIDHSHSHSRETISWLNSYIFRDLLLKKHELSAYPRPFYEKVRVEFNRYFKEIEKEIDNYKYTDDNPDSIKTHPTSIWRSWNIFIQEKDILENIKNENKNVTTTEYVKINLSRFKELDYLKSILEKNPIFPDTSLDLKNTNDPRFYISEVLLTDGTSISYNIYSSTSEDISSIGVLKDDNTIILRANDVFRIASLSIAQDINKLNNPLCTMFFSKGIKIYNM